MNLEERLNNSYNEELNYLDSMIRILNQNITVSRNMDVNIFNCLGKAYIRREEILKSQIAALQNNN